MTHSALLLPRAVRRQLETAAAGARPEECCGILLGRRAGAAGAVVTRAIAAENVAVRDRERRYTIDPAAILGAWRHGRERGESIIGFYHSHPGGTSCPSGRDDRDAWAGMSYLILASSGTTCEVASWRRGHGGALEPEELRCPDSTEVAA